MGNNFCTQCGESGIVVTTSLSEICLTTDRVEEYKTLLLLLKGNAQSTVK